MKTTKIKIKNLFGISETELDGSSVEITGKKGTGKSSVLDSIRLALTNASDRDYVVKSGASEGEIIIETDGNLIIDRKKRTDKSDYKSIKEFGREVQKPQEFLNDIFTPLQLDPVAFCLMSRQDQNRMILDLIDFEWDLDWVRDQFGEIPKGIDYKQNILQVLNDIQAERGAYFQERQDVNREIREKNAIINDIAKDIPPNYQADKWEKFDLGEKYRELEGIRNKNDIIARAKMFKDSYDNKLRGIQADKEIAISAEEKAIANEREQITGTIERLKAEIRDQENRLTGLDGKLTDKKKVIEAQYQEALAKLDKDTDVANEYADVEPTDTAALAEEVQTAESMKKHLNEYARMRSYQTEVDRLTAISEEYTRKIELARELPSEILKTATIPIEGLEIKDGIPLIHGLPVSNLSDGEKLDLCVDVAISKKNNLQIVLVDGAERLDDKSRAALYEKCKEKGLQLIATRTTNSDEMEITKLW